MATFALSALILGAAFDFMYGFQLYLSTSLSRKDLASTYETLQSEIFKLQSCPKVLVTFMAKGNIWGHVGCARSDGGMF